MVFSKLAERRTNKAKRSKENSIIKPQEKSTSDFTRTVMCPIDLRWHEPGTLFTNLSLTHNNSVKQSRVDSAQILFGTAISHGKCESFSN